MPSASTPIRAGKRHVPDVRGRVRPAKIMNNEKLNTYGIYGC